MSVTDHQPTLDTKSIIVLIIAALVAAGSIGGVAAGFGSSGGLQIAVAQEEGPGETTVRLEPSSATVNSGQTTTYDVVVQDPVSGPNGSVGAYDLTVWIDESQVASITDFDAAGNPDFTDVNEDPGNSSVRVVIAAANIYGDDNISIGTVTVRGQAPGSSGIGLSVNALGDPSGSSYTVTETPGGSITVESSEPEPGPADFEVDNLQAPSSAMQGDLIDVSAEIENTGESEDTQTVGFRIGASGTSSLGPGDELPTQQVTLDSGETETVTFNDIDTSGLSPGEYTHGIFTEDDSATATITIEERPQTTVSLQPSSATVETGETTTYDVVADNASEGIAAYNFTVDVADTSAASITDAEALVNPSDQTTDVSVANDGSSVEVVAAIADTTDTGSVAIGSVTVEGVAPGNSAIGLSVDALGTEAGDGYEVTDTSGASITVETSGADPDPDPDPDPEPDPEPPTADAGENQTVSAGTTVTPDASGSTDPDGDSLSYTWPQIDGPDVTLSESSTASPSFTAPAVDAETTLTFEVEVSDGEGGTDTDEVTVTVRPVETEGAFFEVTALDVPDRAAQGESVEVTGEVTNTGDAEGTQTVEIRVDDDGTLETMQSRSITLSTGESFSMTTTHTVPIDLAPGTYTGGLFTEDSSQTDTIEVVAAQPKETFTRDEIAQAKYGYDFDELSDETSREVEELYLRQPFADGAQPEDVKTRDETAQERHDRNFDELSRETTIGIQSDFDAQFGDTGDGAEYTRDEIARAKYGLDFDELSTETSGQVEELYNRQPFADGADPSDVRTREEIANEEYGMDLDELSRETRLEIERTYHDQFAESAEDGDQAPT